MIFEFNVIIGYFGMFQGFKKPTQWMRLKVEVKFPLSALRSSMRVRIWGSKNFIIWFNNEHVSFLINVHFLRFFLLIIGFIDDSFTPELQTLYKDYTIQHPEAIKCTECRLPILNLKEHFMKSNVKTGMIWVYDSIELTP